MVLNTYFDSLIKTNSKIIAKDNSDNYINVLNGVEFKESEDIMIYILKPVIQLVVQSMQSELNDFLYQQSQASLVLFILNTFYVLIGYLIYVLPYENSLKDEIKRTQKMIEIIPEEIQFLYMKHYYERE